MSFIQAILFIIIIRGILKFVKSTIVNDTSKGGYNPKRKYHMNMKFNLPQDIKNRISSSISTETTQENNADTGKSILNETENDIFEKQYDKPFVNHNSNNINQTKIKVLILIYVFYEDNASFSRKDKKYVQSYINKVSSNFDRSSKIELNSLINERPNLDYIFDTVKHYEIEYDFILEITSELRKLLGSKPDSDRVFRRIEDRVTYEI